MLQARDEELFCCFDSAPYNLFAELLSGERRLMTVTCLDQLPQTKITSAIRKPNANEQIVLPYTCMGVMTFHLSSSTKPLPKVRIPAHLPHDTDRGGRGWQTSLTSSSYPPTRHVQWKNKTKQNMLGKYICSWKMLRRNPCSPRLAAVTEEQMRGQSRRSPRLAVS